jgi:hypothetical protein
MHRVERRHGRTRALLEPIPAGMLLSIALAPGSGALSAANAHRQREGIAGTELARVRLSEPGASFTSGSLASASTDETVVILQQGAEGYAGSETT